MDQQTPTAPATPVTVEELDRLLQTYANLEAKKKAFEKESDAKVTEMNKELQVLEGRVTAYLKDLGRTSYESEFAKAAIKHTWRVNMPKDDIAKMAFFNYLKERGLFEKYATVQSQSLNAYYRAEWKLAEERGEGMSFTMPGIEAPKVHEHSEIKGVN